MMSGDGGSEPAWSTRTDLKDNELEFAAQMVPNDPAIVAGLTDGVEMSPGDLAAHGRPGMVVKLSGTVQAGEQGSVDGPLSGMSCAWYRSWITHQPGWLSGQALTELLPSDRMTMLHGGTSIRSQKRNRAEISDVPFRVGDAVGFVEIDPRFATVDTDVLACNGVEGAQTGAPSFNAEWVLPLHQRVTVVGTLGPDLRLLTGPDTTVFVSTKDPQRMLVRRSSNPARYRRRLRALQRRRHDRANRFARGSTRAAVAVVALLVVIIVLILALSLA